MSGEISKPVTRKYWVARDESGQVIRSGYTEPNHVTTTGQANLVSGTRADQVVDIASFRGDPEAWNYEWDGEQWQFVGDDVIYVPAAPHVAENLSRGLFALIYGNTNGLYAKLIPHPSDPAAHTLLQCRSTDVIPVALGADPQPLADVLQITVDDGALLQSEADGIVAAVQAQAGQTVNLIDFIPASWQPYVMDKAGAIAAGYFPGLEVAP